MSNGQHTVWVQCLFVIFIFITIAFGQQESETNFPQSFPVGMDLGLAMGPVGAGPELALYYFRSVENYRIWRDYYLPEFQWRIGFGGWRASDHDLRLRDRYLLIGLRAPFKKVMADWTLFGEVGLAFHYISAAIDVKNPDITLRSAALRYGTQYALGCQYKPIYNITAAALMGFDVIDRTNSFFIKSQFHYYLPSIVNRYFKKVFSFIGL